MNEPSRFTAALVLATAAIVTWMSSPAFAAIIR